MRIFSPEMRTTDDTLLPLVVLTGKTLEPDEISALENAVPSPFCPKKPVRHRLR